MCYRAGSPPRIDGKLDDAAWKAAPWTEAFVDIEGDRKPKPRYRTRVKMLWDDEVLYIGAELEEPHVWATLTEHDSVIFHDNDFEVFLDPDGDSHLYAELEMNALNTTWDLLLTMPYKDGGPAHRTPGRSPACKTAVHIDGTLNDPRDKDRGWTVEIAWPWEGLTEIATARVPAERWRPVAHQLLARRVGHEVVGRQISQGGEPAGTQLGLVAAGRDRHAPPGALGLSAIQHGQAGQRGIEARPGWAGGTCCTECIMRSGNIGRSTGPGRGTAPARIGGADAPEPGGAGHAGEGGQPVRGAGHGCAGRSGGGYGRMRRCGRSESVGPICNRPDLAR